MLYDGESCCFSKSYHLHIVDRVGGGTDAQMTEAELAKMIEQKKKEIAKLKKKAKTT